MAKYPAEPRFAPRLPAAPARGPLWERMGYPCSSLCTTCELPEPALMPGPDYVTLLVTWRCNSACAICPIGTRKKTGKPELSTTTLMSIIEQLDALRTNNVILSGGEPMLRPDIFEVIQEVNRRKIAATCALCTNGTLLDQDRARRLAGSGIRMRVVISLDGADAATHDAIRGVPGSFSKVTNGIRHLVEAFGGGEHVGINTIVNRRNHTDLYRIMDLLARLGVGTLKLAPLFPDSARDELVLAPEDLMTLVEDSPRILDYGRTLGLQVINLIPFSVVSMRACFMPWLSMVIDPEGWVGPCNAALGGFGGRDRRFRFGNVRESRIEEIWKGCGFDTFRRGALRREHDVCGHRHCGDVTINAMNYIRGPCRNCSTGAPITYPFRRVTEIGRT